MRNCENSWNQHFISVNLETDTSKRQLFIRKEIDCKVADEGLFAEGFWRALLSFWLFMFQTTE